MVKYKFSVEGMMCHNCEKHAVESVKNAVESTQTAIEVIENESN